MEIKYYENTVLRYFLVVGAVYEFSTDSLEELLIIIKGRKINEIMLLDIHERKWIDVDNLLKKQKKNNG